MSCHVMGIVVTCFDRLISYGQGDCVHVFCFAWLSFKHSTHLLFLSSLAVIRRKKLMKQAVNILSATSSATPNGSAVGGLGVGSPGSPRHKSAQGKSPKVEKSKLTITSSLTFQDLHSEAEQGEEPATSDRSATLPRQKVYVTCLVAIVMKLVN